MPDLDISLFLFKTFNSVERVGDELIFLCRDLNTYIIKGKIDYINGYTFYLENTPITEAYKKSEIVKSFSKEMNGEKYNTYLLSSIRGEVIFQFIGNIQLTTRCPTPE